MKLRTVLFWVVAAFVVYAIYVNPGAVGGVTLGLAHVAGVFLAALASFANRVIGGHP